MDETFISVPDIALEQLDEVVNSADVNTTISGWAYTSGPFGVFNAEFISQSDDASPMNEIVQGPHAPPTSPLDTWESPIRQPRAQEGLHIRSLSHGSPYLPQNARFLLSHYTSCVIDSLSTLPMPKAPWKGLHVPCALSAYAELDFLGQSNLARVSVLYGLLSIASFHLSALHQPPTSTEHPSDEPMSASNSSADNPNHTYWMARGQKYREIARMAYHKAIRTLHEESKDKLKYKEILMAALNLMCTSVSH